MHLAAEGGSLDVIKYLLPMFGARVHERDPFSYTMLHWAAQKGHSQVARYLITELKLDPQDRDKVFGGARGLCWFQSARSTCVHGLVCAVKHVVTNRVTWTSLCTVLRYAFRVLSHSLLTGSCLVMDHQCIVFTSFSQPVIRSRML